MTVLLNRDTCDWCPELYCFLPLLGCFQPINLPSLFGGLREIGYSGTIKRQINLDLAISQVSCFTIANFHFVTLAGSVVDVAFVILHITIPVTVIQPFTEYEKFSKLDCCESLS